MRTLARRISLLCVQFSCQTRGSRRAVRFLPGATYFCMSDYATVAHQVSTIKVRDQGQIPRADPGITPYGWPMGIPCPNRLLNINFGGLSRTAQADSGTTSHGMPLGSSRDTPALAAPLRADPGTVSYGLPLGSSHGTCALAAPVLAGSKRRRPEDLGAEAEPGPSTRRDGLPDPPPSQHQLSETNLNRFNRETKRLRRRRYPRPSSVVSDSGSAHSSNSAAFYRYSRLEAANVFFAIDPSADLQAEIDHIVKARPCRTRLQRLGHVARDFHYACKVLVKANVSEDDYVELFRSALAAMRTDENFVLRAKADWREDLKPKILQSNVNFDFLLNPHTTDPNTLVQEGDRSPSVTLKFEDLDEAISATNVKHEHSTGQSHVSPQFPAPDTLNQTHPDAMPGVSQPSQDAARESSKIRTPRPNISIGISRPALSSRLFKQSNLLNNHAAKQFIEHLQSTMKVRDQEGRPEALLISMPTRDSSDLVFPFAVIEGEAYSTGKRVFEAQNEAGVAGASALKMQLDLNRLTAGIGGKAAEHHPLFFSICSQGPYHELWVHHVDVQDDVFSFNMTMLKYCNGMVMDGLEDFMTAVDNVLLWGSGPFLDSIVARLGKLARKACF